MPFDRNSPIQQAAAVPYRRRNAEPEFCLITSIRKGRWGVPKGIIDPGETAVQTALKEALEEAGLHGHIEGKPLGKYEYYKWDSILVVTVLLMQVTGEDEDWEEADLRSRCWCRADEARRRLRHHEVRRLLDAALERIGA